MNARLLIVLSLGATLAGFALRPDVRSTDVIDPQLLRANNERWQSLPEVEREALRERFRRFRSLPPGEQEALDQRSATLRRLRARLSQRQGHEPTAEEAALELSRVVKDMQQRIQDAGGSAATTADLLAQLDNRTRRCIEAFFDNLGRRQRLSQPELARLRSQSLPEQLRDALLLFKAEQINLYAEGARPDEADALLPLSPLDVAAFTERQRPVRGYFGKLGRWVPLTDGDRKFLADADNALEFKERLRELKSPQLRELFIAQGLAAERVEALLSGPVNELEREADEVLATAAGTEVPTPH